MVSAKAGDVWLDNNTQEKVLITRSNEVQGLVQLGGGMWAGEDLELQGFSLYFRPVPTTDYDALLQRLTNAGIP